MTVSVRLPQHLRLQTWFPFQLEVCLNGREWLCRQLDKAHLDYERQDNYLAWIQDALLEAINRGEFALNGLRNRDLRTLLYSGHVSKDQQRKQAARISRRLALLRAHKILRKVPHSHRYQLTHRGRLIATALLTARNANIQQLEKLAA